jgi:hypothetical protein
MLDGARAPGLLPFLRRSNPAEVVSTLCLAPPGVRTDAHCAARNWHFLCASGGYPNSDRLDSILIISSQQKAFSAAIGKPLGYDWAVLLAPAPKNQKKLGLKR